MPKAGHSEHGQPKTERLNASLSPDGKQGLMDMADSYGVSVSELLEQIGRGAIPVGSPGELVVNSYWFSDDC
ncbi:hypothetical protein SPB21_05685 [Leptothoe sp. ISB3NOV94-8A]